MGTPGADGSVTEATVPATWGHWHPHSKIASEVRPNFKLTPGPGPPVRSGQVRSGSFLINLPVISGKLPTRGFTAA